MRWPWQKKGPPLALRVVRELERRGVGIRGLAVETKGRDVTLRGAVTSDVVHDLAIETARSVNGVDDIHDRLTVIDPAAARPRRQVRHGDCTGEYVVRRGDTLERIALRVLGDRSRWRDLLAANPTIVSDPGRLPAGLKLNLPR